MGGEPLPHAILTWQSRDMTCVPRQSVCRKWRKGQHGKAQMQKQTKGVTANSKKQLICLYKNKKKMDEMATTENMARRKKTCLFQDGCVMGKGQEHKMHMVRRNRPVTKCAAVASRDVAFQYAVRRAPSPNAVTCPCAS